MTETPRSNNESAPLTIKAVKAQWRADQDIKMLERQQRRRWQRRCFWTRPIGHAWEYNERPYFKVCAACEKEVYVG